MPEPVEVLILEAFETALRGMTGTRPWGGTYANAPRVVPEYLEPGTPAVVWSPTLCVLDANGGEFHQHVGRGGYQHHMPVAVYGYVQKTTDAPRRTWLMRLWKDHVLTLLGDQALAELVYEIKPDQDRSTDEGELEPWGAFRQTWTVSYDDTYLVARSSLETAV